MLKDLEQIEKKLATLNAEDDELLLAHLTAARTALQAAVAHLKSPPINED